MEWKTIDTAPDDGTDFVAWFDCEDGKFPHVCRIEYRFGKPVLVSSWSYDGPEVYYRATHWMTITGSPE